MPASTITWLNKIDGLDLANPQKNVNAADMNEIKATVNANAALHDSLATSVAGAFVENEVPIGIINGVNKDFTIANTPIVGSVKLYINGIRLKAAGVGYSISGPNITMVLAPETGDILLADYRK